LDKKRHRGWEKVDRFSIGFGYWIASSF